MSQTYREYLEEVKSIKPRTLRVPLSDADVRRISELASCHGLNVETQSSGLSILSPEPLRITASWAFW